MTLVHEYDRRGGHRIVLLAPRPDDAGSVYPPRSEGEWTSYLAIAELQVHGRLFIATTDYHGLCGNAIVEITAPNIQQTEERQ